MLVSFIVFCLCFFAIIIILIAKVPSLSSVNITEGNEKDFISNAKEKIEDSVKREIKEKVEDLLQNILSATRKIILKIEQLTTKMLYRLKRNKKKR